jgi:ElaB/YqjD/DUF883 family membrane-anchored ribosome-binding protein
MDIVALTPIEFSTLLRQLTEEFRIYCSRSEDQAREWRDEVRKDLREVDRKLASIDNRMLQQNGRVSKNEQAIALLNQKSAFDSHQESQDRLEEQRSKDEAGHRTTDKWLAFANRLIANPWFWITVCFILGCLQWSGFLTEAARRILTKHGY